MYRPPESSFTFNVQQDVSPCETESEGSQPATPRQALIIDEMVHRLARLEAELKGAQLGAVKAKDLENIVEELNKKIVAAAEERISLQEYIKKLEIENMAEEVQHLKEQSREYEERINRLVKEKKGAEDEAQKERLERDAALSARDKIIAELKQLKDEFEKSRVSMVDEHRGAFNLAMSQQEERYEELQQQYDELKGSFESAQNELESLCLAKQGFLEKHQVELDEMKDTLKHALEEGEVLKNNLAMKAAELDTAQTQLAALKLSMEEFEAKEDTSVELQTMRRSYGELITKFDSLSKEYGEKEEILEMTRMKDVHLAETSKINKQMILELQEELSSLATEKNQQIATLKEELVGIKTRRDELLADLDKFKAEKEEEGDRLHGAMASLESDVTQIKEGSRKKVDALNKEIDELSKRLQMGGMEGGPRLLALEQQLTDTAQIIEQLRNQIEEQAKETQSYLSERDKLLKKISISDGERDKAAAEAEALKRALGEERGQGEVEMSRLSQEKTANEHTINMLRKEVEMLRTELGKTEAAMIESSKSQRAAIAAEELAGKRTQEIDAMEKINVALSGDLITAKTDLEEAQEKLKLLNEKVGEERAKRASVEAESAKAKRSFMALIEELNVTLDELKTNVTQKEKEHTELQESYNVLEAKLKHLVDERAQGLKGYGEIEAALERLRGQFEGLHDERKTTEKQLEKIFQRLEGREKGAIELTDSIGELQNAFREAGEMLEMTQRELAHRLGKLTPEEYEARLTQLQDGMNRLMAGQKWDKSFWFAQLEQFQRENLHLRTRLSSVTALLTTLNERVRQLQNGSSQYCPLLSSCCPNASTTSSSLDDLSSTVSEVDQSSSAITSQRNSMTPTVWPIWTSLFSGKGSQESPNRSQISSTPRSSSYEHSSTVKNVVIPQTRLVQATRSF